MLIEIVTRSLNSLVSRARPRRSHISRMVTGRPLGDQKIQTFSHPCRTRAKRQGTAVVTHSVTWAGRKANASRPAREMPHPCEWNGKTPLGAGTKLACIVAPMFRLISPGAPREYYCRRCETKPHAMATSVVTIEHSFKRRRRTRPQRPATFLRVQSCSSATSGVRASPKSAASKTWRLRYQPSSVRR
jgi:hypothetical protein